MGRWVEIECLDCAPSMRELTNDRIDGCKPRKRSRSPACKHGDERLRAAWAQRDLAKGLVAFAEVSMDFENVLGGRGIITWVAEHAGHRVHLRDDEDDFDHENRTECQATDSCAMRITGGG